MMTTELSEDQMRAICVALGWQGGTYWLALEEIKRLRAAASSAPRYRIGQRVKCRQDGWTFVITRITGSSRVDGQWVYTYRGFGASADEAQIQGLA